MRKITRRGRFRCWLATSLAVGLGLGLAPAAPRQSRASQIASTIKLDAEDLDHPIVLDQNGQTIELPTKQQSGPVVLTDGAVPSYIAYQVGGDDSLPQGFPTVDSGSANSNQTTTGPLHLDALVKAQLDQTLAKDGRAAVYNGQDTYLVKAIPPLFGTTGSSAGTTLAWLASQRSTSSSSSGTTQASVPIPAAPVQAQTLIPTSITNPITNSKFVQDLEHLFTLKSGKLVNWNQQSLDALESDLKIDSPKNVAPKHLASTSKPVLAAQVIDGTGSGGTPQPAPVPEPGTLVVFGLVAAALAVLPRQAGRK